MSIRDIILFCLQVNYISISENGALLCVWRLGNKSFSHSLNSLEQKKRMVMGRMSMFVEPWNQRLFGSVLRAKYSSPRPLLNTFISKRSFTWEVNKFVIVMRWCLFKWNSTKKEKEKSMVNELPPAKLGKLWLVGSHHTWEIQKVWFEKKLHDNSSLSIYASVSIIELDISFW